MPATLSRVWLSRCPVAGNRASVPGVESADAMLTARLAAGDDHALAEAFDRLGPAVYGAALRILGEWTAAQDVVQDVFVELWSNPGRYDPAAGSLRTYLTVLARHRAHRAQRAAPDCPAGAESAADPQAGTPVPG